MGLIPKPIVERPFNGMKSVKKIGYFPRDILARIEKVKQLKRQGHYIEDISRRFRGMTIDAENNDWMAKKILEKERITGINGQRLRADNQELKVTFEDVSFPAYLVNYNFEVEWINHEAEVEVFQQDVSRIKDVESRNIFKLFFNWAVHSHPQNWKGLVNYHMSFAKTKFSKTWLAKLYRGITEREVNILEEVYEEVSSFPKQSIKDTHIILLLKEGTTKSYRVYNVFFKEGIFFNYAPAAVLYDRREPDIPSDLKYAQP